MIPFVNSTTQNAPVNDEIVDHVTIKRDQVDDVSIPINLSSFGTFSRVIR